MAQSNFDRMMAHSNFGTAEQKQAMLQSSSERMQAKQATVDELGKTKAILLGGDDLQRRIVTAYDNDNRLGHDEQVRDALEMDPFAFVVKYGPALAGERQRIRDAYAEYQQDKSRERSTVEIAQDTPLQVGKTITGMASGLATLGALGKDALTYVQDKGVDVIADLTGLNVDYQPEYMSPGQAELGQAAEEFWQSHMSETTQESDRQLALENELDREDRIAERKERTEANDGDSLKSWAQQQGEAVIDVATNAWNNPVSLTGLGVNGLASLYPIAKAAQLAGKSRVLADLARKGVVGDVALAVLKTKEGKKQLAEAAAKSVPQITAVVTGGDAASGAQIAILGMTSETLHSLPGYKDFVDQGLTDDEIRERLAVRAGSTGAVSGALVGYLAGFMNRGFDSAPIASTFRQGATKAMVAPATNFVKEGAQEFVEEGFGSQMSANLGVKTVDPSQPAFENVTESGTLGALIGGPLGGGLSLPGAVIGSAQLTGSLANDAVKARAAAIDASRDEDTTYGTNAQRQAAEDFERSSANIIAHIDASQETPPHTAQDETTPESTAPSPLSEVVSQAKYVSEDELKSYGIEGDAITQLADEEGKVHRTTLMQLMADTVADEKATPADRISAGLSLLGLYEKQDVTGTTEFQEALDALPEGEEKAEALTFQASSQTLRQSPLVQAVIETVSNLTSEQVAEILPLQDFKDGKLSEVDANEVVIQLGVLARYNPKAIPGNEDVVAIALNQRAATEQAKEAQTVLKRVVDILAAMATAQSQYSELSAEQEAAFDALIDAVMEERGPEADREAVKAELSEEQTPFKNNEEVSSDVFKLGFVEKKHISKTTGEVTHVSLDEHISRIEQSAATNDTTALESQLWMLQQFILGQFSKLEAYNLSAEKWNANGRKGKAPKIIHQHFNGSELVNTEPQDGVYANPGNLNSVANARTVSIDTKLTTEVYNRLYQAHKGKLPADSSLLAKGALKPPTLSNLLRNSMTRMPKDGVSGLTGAQADFIAKQKSAEPKPKAKAEPKPKKAKVPRVNKRQLEKDAGGKRPLTSWVIANGGVRVGGTLHAELRANDITAGDARGLFKHDSGISDVDQLDPSDTDLAHLIGLDEAGNALDTDAFTQTLIEEIQSGVPFPITREQADARAALDALEETEAAADRELVEDQENTTPTQPEPVETKLEPAPEPEPENVIDRLNRKVKNAEFAQATPEQEQAMLEAVQHIEEFTDLPLVGMVKTFATIKSKTLTGYAAWEDGVLALAPEVLAGLTDVKNMHILVHELGHLLDHFLGEGTLETSKHTLFSAKAEGKLYQEIVDQAAKNEQVKKAFKYALSHASDAKKASELFAELFAYVVMFPERTKEVLPNGTEFIEDIIRDRTGRDPVWYGRQPSTHTAGRQGTLTDEDVSRKTPEKETAQAEQVRAEPTPLASVFDKLIKVADGISRFTQTFLRRSGDTASDFLDSVDPMQELRERLYASDSLSKTQKDTLWGIVEELTTYFSEDLLEQANALLDKPYTVKGTKTTRRKLWKEGNLTFLTYADAASLHFFDLNEENDIELNPHIATASAMAVVDWILADLQRDKTHRDWGKLAKVWGLPKEVNPYTDADIKRVLNNGPQIQAGVISLAQRIEAVLGIKANKREPTKYVQGLANSLAGSLLSALDSKGNMIRVERATISMEIGPSLTLASLGANTESKLASMLMESFAGKRDILISLFKGVSAESFSYGKPIAEENISRHRIRRPGQKNSALENKVLDRMISTKYYLNIPGLSFLAAFGANRYMELMGYTDRFVPATDKEGNVLHNADGSVKMRKVSFNKQHEQSVIGKNQSITSTMHNLVAHIQGMKDAQTQEEHKDTPLGAIPGFSPWAFSDMGRMMQQGQGTPQNMKGLRNLFVAGKLTNDVSDENSTAYQDLWLTVAQALGLDIDTVTHDIILPEVQALVEDSSEIAEILTLMKAWYKDNPEALGESLDPTTVASMPDAKADRLVELLGSMKDLDGNAIPFSPLAFAALMTVAQYQLTKETNPEGLKTFTTYLTGEADGVTDGIINALVLLSIGEYDEDRIEALAMGGIYFTDDLMTLADYKQIKREDVYTIAKTFLQKALKNRAVVLKRESDNGGDKIKIGMFHTVLTVLDALSVDVSYTFTDMFIEFTRNFMKSPAMIFNYGAARRKMSEDILNNVIERLYEVATEALQQQEQGQIKNWKEHELFVDNPDLISAINDMFYASYKMGWNGDAELKENTYPMTLEKLFSNLRDTKLHPAQYAHLANNVEFVLGDALVDSIDRASGGLSKIQAVIQATVGLQAALFQSTFHAYLEQELEAKGLKSVLELSQEELNDVMQRAQKTAPIYSLQGQTFQPVDTVKSESRTRVAESMTGKFGVNARVPGVADPGVKVSPQLVIGTGDARSVLHIYEDGSSLLDESLMIWDGIELPIGKFQDGSKVINEGILKNYLETNTLRAVADSLSETLRNVTDEQLDDPDVIQAVIDTVQRNDSLKRLLSLDWAAVQSMSPQDLLTELSFKLDQWAMSAQAHINTRKRLPMSLEHLAAGQNPATKDGDGNVNIAHMPGTYEPGFVKEIYNHVYNEELDKLKQRNSVKRSRPAVQPATTTMDKFVESVSTKVKGFPGLRQTSGHVFTTLKKHLLGKLLNEQNNELFSLMWDVLRKDPKLAETKFVFGTSEELTKYRNTTFEHFRNAPDEVGNGQYLPQENVILIANNSQETVFHEMVHAHFTKILVSYAADPNSVPPHVRAAIERLIALKQEFLGKNFDNEPKNTRLAAEMLKAELQDMANRKLPHLEAYQLSEFLAWTLTNQHLVEFGKKTKTYTPLTRFLVKILQAFKDVLGIKGPGRSMFSQLRFFSAAVTAADPDLVIQQEATNVLDSGISLNQRRLSIGLASLGQRFQERLDLYLHNNTNDMLRNKQLDSSSRAGRARALSTLARSAQELQTAAFDAQHRAEDAGFVLSAEQQENYRTIYMVLTSKLPLDGNINRKLQDVFGAVMDKIAPEHLTDISGTFQEADDMFLNLTGSDAPQTAPQQTTSSRNKADMSAAFATEQTTAHVMANFMALSMVHPGLQNVLSRFERVKDTKSLRGKGFNAGLEQVGKNLMSYMSHLVISHKPLGNNVQQQLETLMTALAKDRGDENIRKRSGLMAGIDRINAGTSRRLQKGAKNLSAHYAKKGKTAERKNKKVQATIFKALSILSSVGNEEEAQVAASGIREALNESNWQHMDAFRSFARDIIGSTDTTKAFDQLINKTKTMVDRLRQEFRDILPKVIAEQFSRKLSKKEWTLLSKTLGRTAIVALGRSAALSLAKSPSSVVGLIEASEAAVRRLSGRHAQYRIEKAKQLAEYSILQQDTKPFLLTNAAAIAAATKDFADISDTPDMSEAQELEKLITLYSFQLLSDTEKDMLRDLANEQEKGVSYALGMFDAIRLNEADAKDIQNNSTALLNHWHGYLPELVQGGHDIIIAEDTEQAALERMGYTRVRTYSPDHLGNQNVSLGVYYSTVGGKTAYRQGVMQTVHSTFNGVDQRNGRDMTGRTFGRLTGLNADRITRKGRAGRSTNSAEGHPVPDFNSQGELVGYSLPFAKEDMARVRKDEHFGRLLGAWNGRIVEEQLSKEQNKESLELLRKQYEDASATQKRQFVDVATSKDPVLKDAWDSMGQDIKDEIARMFGKKKFFPVYKDLVNDAVGYRGATIVDSWTGVTRFSNDTQKAVRDVATVFLGKNAYKKLRIFHDVWTEAISWSKTNIVVRSIMLAFDNTVSNVLHMQVHGITPFIAARRMIRKFGETFTHMKNEERIIRLNGELASETDDDRIEILKARIQGLREANAKMSIAPMVEANELSTVSEGMTEADQAIYDGRISEWIGKATEKLPFSLPQNVTEFLKNVFIFKDTTTFQTLNRLIQVGDFAAKSVLYDHLTQVKKMTDEQAKDIISEEFVNYNRAAGRTRDALESYGMLWFMNYALRIIKVMARNSRNNPFYSLMVFGGIGPATDVDTVFTGSAAGKLLDGSWKYSVGLGQGYDGLFASPIGKVLN